MQAHWWWSSLQIRNNTVQAEDAAPFRSDAAPLSSLVGEWVESAHCQRLRFRTPTLLTSPSKDCSEA